MALSTYILIPAHNRKTTTLRCLTILRELGVLGQYSVVLVDDGSTDGTADAVYQTFPEVQVLIGNGHLWWTGAIEMAMRYAYSEGAEYLIWFNDDCRVEIDIFSKLVSLCSAHSKSIVGCQGYNAKQTRQVVFGGKRKTWKGYRWLPIPEGTIHQCDLLSGNLVCIPRSVVDRIGYPDTAKTPHYGGDALYLIRAQNAGFQLFIDARYSDYDTAVRTSQLYPEHWLLAEGSALKLLELVITPQSGLSWRIWFSINWEAYNCWGLIMFLKKYLSVFLVTMLRFLPFSLRKNLHINISTSST